MKKVYVVGFSLAHDNRPLCCIEILEHEESPVQFLFRSERGLGLARVHFGLHLEVVTIDRVDEAEYSVQLRQRSFNSCWSDDPIGVRNCSDVLKTARFEEIVRQSAGLSSVFAPYVDLSVDDEASDGLA